MSHAEPRICYQSIGSRKPTHQDLAGGSNRSVTDTGLSVGFSQTSSFTTAFHKATGLTPGGLSPQLLLIALEGGSLSGLPRRESPTA
jgi:AraC-like DNA-binding protein